jgi:hypothetical protein
MFPDVHLSAVDADPQFLAKSNLDPEKSFGIWNLDLRPGTTTLA